MSGGCAAQLEDVQRRAEAAESALQEERNTHKRMLRHKNRELAEAQVGFLNLFAPRNALQAMQPSFAMGPCGQGSSSTDYAECDHGGLCLAASTSQLQYRRLKKDLRRSNSVHAQEEIVRIKENVRELRLRQSLVPPRYGLLFCITMCDHTPAHPPLCPIRSKQGAL